MQMSAAATGTNVRAIQEYISMVLHVTIGYESLEWYLKIMFKEKLMDVEAVSSRDQSLILYFWLLAKQKLGIYTSPITM